MATATLPASMGRKSWLDYLLGLAAEVHPGEGLTAILLAFDVFLLLGAYYILKPIREALILTGGGAEVKSYSGAAQAAMLLLLVPAYGAFASKVNRIRLINAVTVFFLSNLVLFFFLGRAGTPMGIPYFLWVGIFNVMVIAQFWGFANDIYTPERGLRLFVILQLGSALGAVAGSELYSILIKRLDNFQMMLVAGGILLVSLAFSNIIHLREGGGKHRPAEKQKAEEPLGKVGGFQLVLRHRYLLFIGLLTLTIQWINTNGEYMLGRAFSQAAKQAVAAGTAGGLNEAGLIGSYYANFQFWQNILVGVIQFFLVSRILKYLGIRLALFIPPLISLGGYSAIALAPILATIRTVKIFENSTDYSLENTVRHALFLPTSREAKYKAKQAVDSFFWRAGDMLSALGVFFVIKYLALDRIAMINAGFIAVWLLLAFAITREHRKLTAEQPAAM